MSITTDRPPDPITTLRDLGLVDISTTVAVHAGGDEKQTPVVVLTLDLDDASLLAAVLDEDGYCPELVVSIRKALGLAGCWVDFQDGVA